jgi:hypothetical protein
VGKSWPGTRDAVAWIQGIPCGDDRYASANEADGPVDPEEELADKKSRMITRLVSCASSGHSVTRHAVPLLGMSDLHDVGMVRGGLSPNVMCSCDEHAFLLFLWACTCVVRSGLSRTDRTAGI